jgi:mRNA-degrading endonuclease RelE of RelBE toxin-antitoxin system
MKHLIVTEPAKKMLAKLPQSIQKKANKQFLLLLKDLRHPSIHAKKYNESLDIWQGRIDQSYRFYFRIINDSFIIYSLQQHPK